MSKQDRRDFLRIAGLSAIAPAVRGVAQTPATSGRNRPNLLIVMSDQHYAGVTKRSGFPLDTMPTLDRLAESGAGFHNAYACAPLCVPSRVSMLTGRWPHAHRVRQNSAAEHAVFEKDIFDVAKALGYRTGLAGKNHSYLKPSKLDFWRVYSHLGGWKAPNAPREIVEFDKWLLRENFAIEPEPSPFPAEAQHPYRIVSDACEFIGAKPEQPFALWVSFPEPHNPYQVSEPYYSMFPPDSVPPRGVGPEVIASKGFKWQWLRGLEEDANPGYDSLWRRTRSNYLGMLRLIDDQIKRLLAFLDNNHLRENTLIIYLSDHGDYFCDYGLIHKGVGMPEDLIRIPMVWSGAGVAAKLSPDAFVSTADIMPTLCEALGVEIPHGAQGRSLWPLLQNRDYPREEFRSIYSEVGFGGMYYDAGDHVPYSIAEFRSAASDSKLGFDELDKVTQSGNLKMVRMGEWKLYFDMLGNGELYHLPSDPFELKNRFNDASAGAQRHELMADLLMWTIRTEDDLPLAGGLPNQMAEAKLVRSLPARHCARITPVCEEAHGKISIALAAFENKGMRHAPGPGGWKALGFFGGGSARSTVQFVENVSRRFGPVASFRILHKRIYLVDDADLVQELLVTRQHEFRRDTGATLGRELVGDGLLTREEPLHRERRRILQPAFHREQIASYVEAMTTESARLSAEWERKDEFDVRMEMRRVTLSIVGATLFGTEFRDNVEQISKVLQRVVRKAVWLVPAVSVFEPLITAYRRIKPHGRSLFFPNERARLEEIVAPIIAKRRSAGGRDVLSLILNQRDDANAPLTDEDVKNELVTFVLAGYETTATALTWTWYLLAQHPTIAERMRSELARVLAGRTPTLDDVPLLTYTANVFKEAMRLYPPVLLFARRPKHRLKFAGYELTRGESIFISPYVTQRNPRYFARPDSFEPERWENIDIPKFAYFPFGGGAKMCIGEPFARMEGLIVLATLAQRWRLECLSEIPVGLGSGTVLNPDQPMMMRPVRLRESTGNPDLSQPGRTVHVGG